MLYNFLGLIFAVPDKLRTIFYAQWILQSNKVVHLLGSLK
jgi:hypothetical protein